MEILPSCSHVSTTVWLHYLDSEETSGESAREDAAFCLKEILEAAPYKTAAVRPRTFQLTNLE